jgi:hypothetical protein
MRCLCRRSLESVAAPWKRCSGFFRARHLPGIESVSYDEGFGVRFIPTASYAGLASDGCGAQTGVKVWELLVTSSRWVFSKPMNHSLSYWFQQICHIQHSTSGVVL